MNFNLKYKILKQKYKLSKKIKNIKKYGWKGRKFVKCYWPEIERPLIENNKEEVDYFKNRIKDYLQKVSSKKHVEKIFIVTFPHKANLFPTKNKLGQEIYYKANVQKLVEEVLVGFDNIELINFNEEFKGREKYFYDNAYIEFDPHLNENFHLNLFTKTIIKNLEVYLNNSL